LKMDDILRSYNTVAVVGLSSNRRRPSYGVAVYLKKKGYRVIPVNPKESEVLGDRCFPSLLSIGEKVDIVDIFRRPDQVMGVVDEAIQIGARVVWMQEEVVNEEAAARAREAGLDVVMDKCIKKEHQRMVGEEPLPYGVCEVHFDDEG
jgi:predicted CoA-binding protein